MTSPPTPPGRPVPGATASPGGGSALVVGCGLIGTSVALSLRNRGWSVSLADADPAVAATASALGAGSPIEWPPTATGIATPVAAVAVVAVPPAHTATACAAVLRAELALVVMHVASVQSQPQVELQKLFGEAAAGVVGTHPMAGSERGGPAAASPGLFRDRPWVVCPGSAQAAAVATARTVIEACGARPVEMTPNEHDEAVALVSHAPQLASSAVASLLAGAPPAAVGIAGSGVRDVTRLADGDPELWRQIITGNAAAVAVTLRHLTERLAELAEALEAGEPAGGNAVAALMADGQAGRRRLGGKHGGRARQWGSVQVVIPDEPGALVDVLSACRDQRVNLEDLRVEHSPGAPNGVLELLVEPGQERPLADALRARWEVVAVVRPHE